MKSRMIIYLRSLRVFLIRRWRWIFLPLRSLPGTSICFGPPRGIINEEDLLKKGPLSETINLVLVSPGEHKLRTTPLIFGNISDSFFLRRTAAKISPQFILCLPNGRYWDKEPGVIIDANDNIIHSLSKNKIDFGHWLSHAHATIYIPKSRRIRGRSLCLITPCAEGNYYHFLINLLPRLATTKIAGEEIDRFDNILINRKITSKQEQILEIFGIQRQRLLHPKQNEHLIFDELVVPSLANPSLTTDNIIDPPILLSRIRDEIKANLHFNISKKTYKKIYISRRDAGGRKIANESELIGALEAQGFQSLLMSQYTIYEQALIFSHAKVIVAPHGAALSNIIFCRPDSHILELMPSGYQQAYFWSLSQTMNLNYAVYCFENDSAEPSANQNSRFQRGKDFQINVDSIISAINIFIRNEE